MPGLLRAVGAGLSRDLVSCMQERWRETSPARAGQPYRWIRRPTVPGTLDEVAFPWVYSEI